MADGCDCPFAELLRIANVVAEFERTGRLGTPGALT